MKSLHHPMLNPDAKLTLAMQDDFAWRFGSQGNRRQSRSIDASKVDFLIDANSIFPDDLVAGDNCFFAATGITDGDLLRGVHFNAQGATTQSLVMRSRSGTVRLVNANHRIDKLEEVSAVDYT